MRSGVGKLVLMFVTAALAGCAKAPPKDLPVAPGESIARSTSVQPGKQADFLAQMRGADVIYFDTDRFDIDPVDAEALQSQARWLIENRTAHATLEGHCDERGTREYNLGLGERRATAAKNYLVSLGVEPRRLSTVSYGKERPKARGSDEASWSQNRRAVTIVIN